ncbi:MAG TPA: FtsX-like permease family protein [Acidobacteriota bacterium]|nr:FtsX-like permease family protein [Acidobacteriota bacterium]
MLLLTLAYKSLGNRKLTTFLTLGSVALSVALLIGVEKVRTGVRESFSNTISQTDLIVGARGGAIQTILYTVFGMGSASNNISWETYQHFKNHPAVGWTIPYSLGDNHRGFRVVGTDENFYNHYRYRGDRRVRFREGRPAQEVFEVAVGLAVAGELGYSMGDKVAVNHGITPGFLGHDDKPFTVVGILEQTNTPIDRSLYVTLEGISAVHIDWQDGAPPRPGEAIPAEHIHDHDLEAEQITAFFLGTRSRIDTLRLQREINTYEGEAVMAVIPAVALNELWRGIGYAEDGLQVITIFVVVVGLLGMLVSIYTTLNERRREMAILRAVGSGPARIVGLLVLESGLLASAGSLAGTALAYLLLTVFQPVVERRFGLYVPVEALSPLEYAYIGAVLAAGFLIGLVPAFKAYRNTLSDGLSMRL